MKAARIVKTKEPLEIKDVSVPRPKNDQVLVRVESAGVCHSDLHLWEGGYAGPQGVFMKVEDRGVKFPLTPGHEISGAIEEMGESVTGFSKGDKVLVYPWIGEGTCPACRIGEENICDAPRSIGVYQDGGYSELVLVPGDTLVIVGAGGLGLMAVQLAKAITNARIAIVDIDDKKLAEAKRLGADETINSGAGDSVKGVKDITNNLGAEAV